MSVSVGDVYRSRGEITRVRIIADGADGYDEKCKVVEIRAKMFGQTVEVDFPDLSGALWGRQVVDEPGLKGRLIAWAKREGAFAKNIGLLDESVWEIHRP